MKVVKNFLDAYVTGVHCPLGWGEGKFVQHGISPTFLYRETINHYFLNIHARGIIFSVGQG